VKFVLASNSPRRRQLLALGGWEFTVLPADVDENPLPGESPRAYVLRLAETKARAVPIPSTDIDTLILAADTTVADGLDVLGKPADSKDAEAMLRRLRGRTHTVYTALALFRPADGALLTDCCATQVPMRNYSDEEMGAYIASGDPLDKAGAYAIQHPGFKPVERQEGCFANVMGLPLCHLARTLANWDLFPGADIHLACQAALEYACPVYPQVLAFQEEPSGWTGV
jgi:MAF protein